MLDALVAEPVDLDVSVLEQDEDVVAVADPCSGDVVDVLLLFEVAVVGEQAFGVADQLQWLDAVGVLLQPGRG